MTTEQAGQGREGLGQTLWSPLPRLLQGQSLSLRPGRELPSGREVAERGRCARLAARKPKHSLKTELQEAPWMLNSR